MKARLEIRLLGVPSFSFDGAPWAFSAPPRCMSMLALVALAKAPRSRASIAAALWPDELESEARTNFRRHLHRLQRALPAIDGVEWLSGSSATIAWNDAAPAWIDARAFEAALDDPARRNDALEWYRGDLLEGSYEEAILADRERLRARFLDACAQAASEARRRLQFADAARLADRMLALDEWREDAVRLGMAIRYESGDRSSALAQFERFASSLEREMGVEPMAETLALRDAILVNAPLPGGTNLAPFEENELVVPGASMPFVGRRDELATLESAWRHAAGGRGTALFLSGPAGIGKSRMLSEFARSVGEQGARVLFGETSNPQSYPYEPVVDALRRGLAYVLESPLESPWFEALTDVMPELQAAFPDRPPLEPLADAERARTRLLEAMARSFERLARGKPLLLVFEDVHWAQAATLEALEAIARRIRSLPTLLVASFRSGELAPEAPLYALARELASQRYATSLVLEPLSAGDVGAFVERALEGRTPAPDVAAAIAAASGGNPLFAGQLVRNYEETGELPDADRPDASVAHTVLRRAQALDDTVQTLAYTASAIGRSFTIDVLADVLGWSESEVFDGVKVLVERGLVRGTGSSAFSYAFTHALVETAIYEAIPPVQRAVRHRRIASVLARVAGVGQGEGLATIARHWKLGGEPARAARAYAAAAAAAMAVYAREEAIALARSALALAPSPRERFDTAALVADAQRGFGDPEQWKQDVEALESAAEKLGDEDRFRALEERERYERQVHNVAQQRATIDEMLRLAADRVPQKRAVARYADASFEMTEGRFTAALERLNDALALALTDRDATTAAMAREALAQVFVRLGRAGEARAVVEAMRADPEITGSPALRRRLLNAELYVAHGLEDQEAALRPAAELLAVAQEIGDLYAEGLAHAYLALGERFRAPASVVRDHFLRSAEIFERVGAAHSRASSQSNLAGYERSLGLAEEALVLADAAIAQARASNGTQALADRLLERALACSALGDARAAYEAAAEADALAEAMGDRRLLPSTKMAVASAQLARSPKRARAALDAMAAAVDLARAGASVAVTIDHLCTYANALLEHGRGDEAQALATELKALADAHPGKAWYPAGVHWTLGRLAIARGDRPAAARHRELGRHALKRQIERIGDPTAAAAYGALPWHRELVDDFGTPPV